MKLYDDRSDLQFIRQDSQVSGILINHKQTYKKAKDQ